MSKIQINITTIDNYLLIIAGFLSAIAYNMGGLKAAVIVLGLGLALKAIGSALIEGESLVQNLDNVALGLAGVLAVLVGSLGDSYLAVAFSIAGMVLKALASAYVRGDSVSQNLDNIILATFTIAGAILPVYGYGNISFYVLAAGAMFKAMLSNGLRIIQTPTTVDVGATATSAAAPAASSPS